MLKLSILQPENALGTGLASAIKRSSAEGKKQKTRPWQKKKWDHNLESFEEMVGSVDGRLCFKLDFATMYYTQRCRTILSGT